MRTFSARDLELIGYKSAHEVTPTSADGWNLYRAAATAGLESIEHDILYIKSDTTLEQLRASKASLSSNKIAFVFIAPSSKLTKQSVESIFGKQSKVTFSDEIVWSKLKEIFSSYITGLSENVPQEIFFVTPRREGEPKAELDKDLVGFFENSGTFSEDQFLVVKAPAGVGKTTLSRRIVKSLCDRIDHHKVIPIYVESSHWRKLKLESVTELWEIIQSSLQAFSNSVPLSKDLFEHALRAGYLGFIFDGFDELCGSRHGQFDPNELVITLSELASSGAKISLTTRSLYWDGVIQKESLPSLVKIVELASFTRQQALQYFGIVFKQSANERTRAIQFYDDVIRGSNNPISPGGGRAQFVNQPVCVVMIAELVKQNNVALDFQQSSKSVIERLLIQICERESTRQSLVSKAEEQLLAFETIAIDKDFLRETNPEFDFSLLEIAGIQTEDLEAVRSHHLLSQSLGSRFKFRFEFLAPFLRALSLNRQLSTSPGAFDQGAWELMCAEANGKGYLLEHLVELVGLQQDWQSSIKKAFSFVPSHMREAGSFLFHLASQLLEEDANVRTKAEKSIALFSLMSNDFQNKRLISDFDFIGPMRGLDLRGVSFSDCTFSDVSFVQCEVDANTIFSRSTFRGITEIPEAKAWKTIQMLNCRLDPPSNLCWENVLGTTQGRALDALSDSIGYALQKFWHNGHLKTNIKRTDWNKGPLAHSSYRTNILDGMLHLGLISEEVTSSVSEGVYRFGRPHLLDLQRYMDNRQKTGVIAQLFEYCAKKK